MTISVIFITLSGSSLLHYREFIILLVVTCNNFLQNKMAVKFVLAKTNVKYLCLSS